MCFRSRTATGFIGIAFIVAATCGRVCASVTHLSNGDTFDYNLTIDTVHSLDGTPTSFGTSFFQEVYTVDFPAQFYGTPAYEIDDAVTAEASFSIGETARVATFLGFDDSHGSTTEIVYGNRLFLLDASKDGREDTVILQQNRPPYDASAVLPQVAGDEEPENFPYVWSALSKNAKGRFSTTYVDAIDGSYDEVTTEFDQPGRRNVYFKTHVGPNGYAVNHARPQPGSDEFNETWGIPVESRGYSYIPYVFRNAYRFERLRVRDWYPAGALPRNPLAYGSRRVRARVKTPAACGKKRDIDAFAVQKLHYAIDPAGGTFVRSSAIYYDNDDMGTVCATNDVVVKAYENRSSETAPRAVSTTEYRSVAVLTAEHLNAVEFGHVAPLELTTMFEPGFSYFNSYRPAFIRR